MVAVGNSVLVTVYHLLADPDARFSDLGAEHNDSHIDKQRRPATSPGSSRLSPASGS
jgi:transposase